MDMIDLNNDFAQTSLSESNESKTNLIVNYLPQTMVSEELKLIFQSVGQLESCKLIKDKSSQQSMCYGFVNYLNTDDAVKAIQTFNGLRIENKVIKVSYARPSCETIKGANLYICGLPKHWTCDDMNACFGVCGKIITSRILFNPLNGQSKCVGFIRFDQKHEAECAIKLLNGAVPEDSQEQLTVKFATCPVETKPKQHGCVVRTSCSVRSACSFNSNYSNYSNCSNESISFGSSPQNSMQSLNLSSAAPGSFITALNSGWCLFVYNLAPETDEFVLWQLFGPFGAVLNVKVIRDHQTLKCKGFGFVTMALYENALNAINSLNGITLANRMLQVSFKTIMKLC